MKCLLILSLFSVGCSHIVPLGEKDEVWLALESRFIKTVYYCRANKADNGLATPICFEAATVPTLVNRGSK